MKYVIVLIIGLIAGYFVGRRGRGGVGVDSKMQTEVGRSFNEEQQETKAANLGRVMDLVRQKGQVRNDDVEKALGVSNATAERYLNELEKQGRLVQVGSTGQGVFYKLK